MTNYGYGLWFLVIVNSAVFIVFAASFFRPRSKRDWTAMGGFSSFVVALNPLDGVVLVDPVPGCPDATSSRHPASIPLGLHPLLAAPADRRRRRWRRLLSSRKPLRR